MPNDYDLPAIQAEIEASPHDWDSGETSLTRMSDEDRTLRLGVPLPPAEELAELLLAAETVAESALEATDAEAVPAAFNLHDIEGESYVAGVRNQLACGSCVSFGTVATLEGTARWTRGDAALDVDLSEAHLFYGWGKSVGRTCDTGWLPLPAAKFCTDRGVTYESVWPYSDHNSNGGKLPADWKSHRAQSSGVVNLTGNVGAIKRHLNTHGPLAVCYVVYEDFFSYRTGVYRRVSNVQKGGHCVALVGYDDARRAWICKNSWGTGWGDKGFFRIGYGECGIETWQVIGVKAVELTTPTDPDE